MRHPHSERMLYGVALAAVVAALWLGTSEARQQDAVGARATDRFTTTTHAPVPSDLSRMWFAPSQSGGGLAPALADFARGARLLDDEDNAAAALPLVSAGALAGSELAPYARYYTGLALQRLQRLDEAEAAFAAVAAAAIEGHLPEDATLRQAEIREARGDFAGAVVLYRGLLGKRLSSPHVVWQRAAVALEASGRTEEALDAYRRVFYEYPLSAEGDLAESALLRLNAISPRTPDLVARERKRGDVLFNNRRWGPAQKAYERVRAFSEGAERQLMNVRISACDVNLGRHRQGRLALQPYLLEEAPHGVEARFYHLAATRGVGQHQEYERLVEDFVKRHPASPFAEQALDGLATHFILVDNDARAEEVFRRTIKAYPAGRYTERAVWRAGWWAYRRGEFADTIQLFEHGLASFPRSDYRPSWLYWTAKAYDNLGQQANATSRFRIAATDYLNSYYGRLSWNQLQARKEASLTPAVQLAPSAAPANQPPTSPRIATLIAVGLYREALNELQYAQRVWGDSPQLTATIALVQNRLGNLRLGINAMRRAYPQFMASGGERLPDEILRVIFPVNYWPLLEQHAKARGLDPYLIAALVAQESTFDPVIRSSANAIGLMQVLPSTGRQYARRLGIPRFSAARLTEPEVNVRIGTAYFADLVNRFGGAHFALASYNAGESRIVRWQREKPGLPQDEFIDDIPFPETQNYVKRILGTADDYRRLYSNGPVPTVNYVTPKKSTATAAPTRKAPEVKKAPTKKAPAKKAPSKKAPPKKTPAKKGG